jgi:transcription elongation GreA/GreB family factor
MSNDLDTLLERLPDELASEENALAALERAERLEPDPDPDGLRERIPEGKVTVGPHRLLARSLERAGRVGESDQVLLSLAERLNQAGYWTAVGRVAGALLERVPSGAVPLLARARVHGGDAAVDASVLEAAHLLAPSHGLLAWLTAEAARDRGDRARALRLAARALPELVAEKDYETAESALLLLVEDGAPAAVPAYLSALEFLARQGAWAHFDGFLELTLEILSSPRAAAAAWPVVRDLWRRHPERDPIRGAAIRIARAYAARYPDPEAMLRIAEIERPSQHPEGVLERWRRAERFPPGWYARHGGWGIGRIRENDTDSVVVDFPAKPLHRMSMATAEQALEALPPDHLAVLMAAEPEEPARLAREAPAELVIKVLEEAKTRQATADEIRKRLVPAVVASASWTTWWKSCRDALVAHPGVDARQAYAGIFRLAGDETVEEIVLPAWDPRRDATKNLALLETFLAQHPGLESRILETFGDRLRGLTEGPSDESAVAAALFLLRLDPGAEVAPERRIGPGFDVNALPKRDQDALWARALDETALRALFDSRAVTVRREAASRLDALGRLEAVGRDVLASAREHPEAAIDLLEESGLPATLASGDPGWTWSAALAAVDLLERPPREPHRRRVQALLSADSPLGRRLLAAPIPEERRRGLVTRLVKWESSDRFRFPLLDFFRAVGHGDVADAVEGARARAAAVISSRVGAPGDDPYDGAMLLTRPTLERLETERRRIGMELKTTIPRIIQKARELGDLRENAEYESAKAKQATYAKRFEELDGLIHSARLIEELKREPGVAAPGTEIELEPLGATEPMTVWLLGEGDQEVGPGVVSYRAPVGKALMGRRPGDEVALPREGESLRYRVASVRERLP